MGQLDRAEPRKARRLPPPSDPLWAPVPSSCPSDSGWKELRQSRRESQAQPCSCPACGARGTLL